MSDTIRNEEKHIWRERLTSEVSCFNADLSAFALRLLNAIEQAEANVARLTKERDWLADKLAEQNICWATHNKDKTISLRAIDADEWKEVARRAVAAGEETCQK